MRCDELSTALVDLVDGRLDPARQREAERHLEACAGCRALVDDLRTIRAAAFTLDRREPPRRGVGVAQPRHRHGAAVRRPPRRRPAQLDGLDGGGRRVDVWRRPSVSGRCCAAPRRRPGAPRRPLPATPSVESVAAEFEAAEQHYQKAIADLETIARQDTGELDPQVAAVLQKNLTVIDQAISESRTALQSQPASSNAQEGLFDALRTKVALLQQTVELINEMRQGNQAEAARKFQTLSQ